jgi:hypothetical protein
MQKLGYITNLTKIKLDLSDLKRKKMMDDINKMKPAWLDGGSTNK